MPGGFRVIDIWQSRAAFARFGKKLKPAMKEVGMRKVKVTISPLRRFIKA
jgi:hypothetical protein